MVKKQPTNHVDGNISFETKDILRKENILLGLESTDKKEAIALSGKLLVDGGYVKPDYIDFMYEREENCPPI